MLKGITVASAIGFILGVILVWWVLPDTSGATAALIASALIACIIFRSIFLGSNPRERKIRLPGLGGIDENLLLALLLVTAMITFEADTRPAAPVHFEHWCEEPGCKKWGGSGCDVGKGETRWYCYEHRWLEYPLPKTVLS